MKILFFCRLYSPHIGGVEKHVAEISRKLIADGNDITIITEKFDKKLKDYEEINAVKVYRINTGLENSLKKFRIWREIFTLRKLISDADIIHCHDIFFWYLPFRFLYASKPVYVTFHGYESYPIVRKAVFIRKLSEKLSRGNICIGDFIPKWYGTMPDYISYGAVDSEMIKNQNINVKNDSAVFIGRLDEQTGVLSYTKAVEIIRKKIPRFETIIIGDGKYRSVIEKNFKILGFQNEPEKYFPKYHFAFVSRYLSILEAFAAKKLVFAVYDNPVKEDYLKMAPFAKWMIIANNEYSLAKGIDDILMHPEKEKQMVGNAYKWVKSQSWDKLVSEYINLWKK